MSAMAPMMLGMTVGSMVGQLAARAFGQYDLLLPRDPDKALLVVPANIDSFAGEWDLPLADIRMWVLVHELAAHAVLSTPHLRACIDRRGQLVRLGVLPRPRCGHREAVGNGDRLIQPDGGVPTDDVRPGTAARRSDLTRTRSTASASRRTVGLHGTASSTGSSTG